MNNRGCSTCQPGQEQYEFFTVNTRTYIKNRSYAQSKMYIQYDYRTENGELFSCVRSTLEAARIARDIWFEKNVN